MIKYIVTDKSPIDGHQPGADVTGLYPDDVRDRLIEEGFIEAVDDKPKPSRKRKTADDTAADEDGD